MLSVSTPRQQRSSPRTRLVDELAGETPSRVLTQSKKITKAPRSSNVSTPSSDSGTRGQKSGNETYSFEEREQIVNSIRQQIISIERRNLTTEALETFDYTEYLKSIGSVAFDKLIIYVIPQYKPELILDKPKLGQLRKKIKGWFTTRQNTSASKGKRAAMLENEIQDLNQLAGGRQGIYEQSGFPSQIEFAKVPTVFGENVPSSYYLSNVKNEAENIPYYYNKEHQSTGKMSVGELLDCNGLTTRSNSPTDSPIASKYNSEMQESSRIADSYLACENNIEDYYWTKYQDDISQGFWNAAKKLYRFGEVLGI